MTAQDIIEKYISFFEKRNHVRIPNSSLVPENDPTTLFTSSGMQPLVPYLLGEKHPSGVRLVNVQNSFRAQDIDEIGNNRHTTFFRMLGNWSLGDYFKKEEIPWLFEFLTSKDEGLGLDPQKLFVTVFKGNKDVPKDTESIKIWQNVFRTVGIDAKVEEKIFEYPVAKNWWSRSGPPDNMPVGEPGGPDTEVFYDFGAEYKIHENSPFKKEKCHVNCDCGRYIEIANSVFMQYKKIESGFEELAQQNVDFGGGLERMLMATQNQQDVFETNLFKPIISAIEKATNKKYSDNYESMRIVADHFLAAIFISSNHVVPSNKEKGYILRRLIRRGLDHYSKLGGSNITPVIEAIVEEYKKTDPQLVEEYEFIKNNILEEAGKYVRTQQEARKFIEKKYRRGPHPSPLPKGEGKLGEAFQEGEGTIESGEKVGDELMGMTEISAQDAFVLYTTHGLSPTQIKSLGYEFDDQDFANLMEEHQKLSRSGAAQKFRGGLADQEELTVKGHTATHLMHQAIRDVLGDKVHQSGSNITTERVRFDFNYDKKLTDEEIKKVEETVNEKIKADLPVHFEFMPIEKARKLNAIGLFDEKYSENVKVYFIGGPNPHDGGSDVGDPHSSPLPKGEGIEGRDLSRGEGNQGRAYSVEFCGGPHVDSTGAIKTFKIIKEEGLGKGFRRIYAKVT